MSILLLSSLVQEPSPVEGLLTEIRSCCMVALQDTSTSKRDSICVGKHELNIVGLLAAVRLVCLLI